MSETNRNVFGSCLTIMVMIGVIPSLVVVGIGVMIFSLLASA